MKKIMNAPGKLYRRYAPGHLRRACGLRQMHRRRPALLLHRQKASRQSRHHQPAAARGIFPCSWAMWARACSTACGVGGVFQSPSAEQIFNVTKEVENGAGVLYLYGNYTAIS